MQITAQMKETADQMRADGHLEPSVLNVFNYENDGTSSLSDKECSSDQQTLSSISIKIAQRAAKPLQQGGPRSGPYIFRFFQVHQDKGNHGAPALWGST